MKLKSVDLQIRNLMFKSLEDDLGDHVYFGLCDQVWDCLEGVANITWGEIGEHINNHVWNKVNTKRKTS